MWNALIRTENDLAALVLRLFLGVVFFPHGAQKLLGWFGGHGFAGTMNYLTSAQGLPWLIALLVIVAEFFGALALIAGFLTRVAAFGIGAVMVGAIAMVHWQHGFFMNWSGQQAGEGFEFHLLAIGMAIALMIRGGGAASVDRALARK
ncbi:MAG: DoxX family protein [Desulfuromonadales bacterium]|nr:DoxX family protein [Desulfuromonadales bacterium]